MVTSIEIRVTSKTIDNTVYKLYIDNLGIVWQPSIYPVTRDVNDVLPLPAAPEGFRLGS